ncbi:MAG: nitronate monooxygenase [Bacteroidetes bacterium HGW-Bacteroidetes-19]|nr:MAG: nitronate monooxygenase [Bacteroidetes bacterium HGW-Bacteroidetes-19]
MINQLNIGGLIAKVPIVQGGMGVGVSLSGLASAVANEGGIGVISAVAIGMLETDYKKNFKQANLQALRREIQTAKKKTEGIIGVNIMMAVSDFDNLLLASIDEKVDIVFVGAGLPFGEIFEIFKTTSTKFVPIVSSARAAKIIFQHWAEKFGRIPDGVVIEGPLAGGHLGFKKAMVVSPELNLTSLTNIVKETVEILKPFEEQFNIEIPIIAGGGVYTGADIYEVLQAGAKGVQMGTRFVTTIECDVDVTFKEVFLESKVEDITIIDSPVGLPGRVISNDFVKAIQNGEQKPVKCPWKCLKNCDFNKVQFCVAEALFNAAKGDFTKGFAFSGAKGFKATKILSVHKTIEQLLEEYYITKSKNEILLKLAI